MLETQIEDVIVNFVVFETQIEQEGMFPVVRDILSLTGGTKQYAFMLTISKYR